MADEEKNDNTEEKDEAVEEQAPAEEAPKEEAPKEDAPKEEEPEPTPDTPAAEGEDAAADEDEPEPTPDTPAPSGAQAGEAEEVADDAGAEDEDLDWKTRRRLERSRQPAEARPQQSPEERAKQRAAERAADIGERRRYRAGKRGKGEKGTGTPAAERASVARKVRRGTVVSDKADKTITVRIDVARRHPTYEKIVRRSSTLHAHDERNEAGAGDLVQVIETRPLSRNKRWRLTEIIEKAK